MNKIITVFGSSIPKAGDDEYAIAYELGKKLALNKFDVCTGGYKGIMEAVSKGAVDNGSRAIGVTLDYIKNAANKYLSEEIKCSNLFERINKLIELGSAYIVLQGGTGTLLELSAVWEFMNKGLISPKPIIAHSNVWKEIGTTMDLQIKKENRITGLVSYADSVEDIIIQLDLKLKGV